MQRQQITTTGMHVVSLLSFKFLPTLCSSKDSVSNRNYANLEARCHQKAVSTYIIRFKGLYWHKNFKNNVDKASK